MSDDYGVQSISNWRLRELLQIERDAADLRARVDELGKLLEFEQQEVEGAVYPGTRKDWMHRAMNAEARVEALERERDPLRVAWVAAIELENARLRREQMTYRVEQADGGEWHVVTFGDGTSCYIFTDRPIIIAEPEKH